MFALDTFVERCRDALHTGDPSATVAELLREALRDRQEVAAAVKAWREKGGGEYGAIHRAADLTILHASVPPGVESPRHEHTMWAVIGVYEGQEDNTFYRLGDGGIEEVGAASIREGEARVGLEAYYTGVQRLDVNPYRTESRPYVSVGLLAERRFGAFRVFINAENITDVRQTRWDSLLRPTQGVDGRWTVDAWAPLDGRVFNGGVRVEF